MADATFVAGDTDPSIFGALTDSNGDPFDLTDCVVRFQMRLAYDRRYVIDSVATVVSAAAGTVRYDWVAGDLSTAGDYITRWKIVFLDTGIEHTNPENTLTVVSA